jgi:signal transduction histidine kinase
VRTDDEQPELVDIRTVMDSTLRLAANEIKRRAKLVREYRDFPAVMGSDGRVGQVFLNLLVNAAQAIPEGNSGEHTITVRISATADEARIEIADTGCGMSPELQAKLFTPFVTTKPIGIGTGLGLSVCRRIVTALGGTIEFQTAVGVGTTFVVVLPIVPA